MLNSHVHARGVMGAERLYGAVCLKVWAFFVLFF